MGKATVSTDQEATTMVQRGSRIAAVTDLRQGWEFKRIADDTQANAFALPGGEVAVYTGILSITRHEDRPRCWATRSASLWPTTAGSVWGSRWVCRR